MVLYKDITYLLTALPILPLLITIPILLDPIFFRWNSVLGGTKVMEYECEGTPEILDLEDLILSAMKECVGKAPGRELDAPGIASLRKDVLATLHRDYLIHIKDFSIEMWSDHSGVVYRLTLAGRQSISETQNKWDKSVSLNSMDDVIFFIQFRGRGHEPIIARG